VKLGCSQVCVVIGCIAIILATAKISVAVKQILLESGKADYPPSHIEVEAILAVNTWKTTLGL
jgi:hypothetical protein